jgi:hypothetical protein
LSQGPKESCVITAGVGWITVSRRGQTDRGTNAQDGKYLFHQPDLSSITEHVVSQGY